MFPNIYNIRKTKIGIIAQDREYDETKVIIILHNLNKERVLYAKKFVNKGNNKTAC